MFYFDFHFLENFLKSLQNKMFWKHSLNFYFEYILCTTIELLHFYTGTQQAYVMVLRP